MEIQIKEVFTKSELKKFIKFPFKLFKGNKYWIPPLNSDEMDSLDKNRNPSFEYCEARYWLAYKGKEVVGRIAGIINHRVNQKWGYKYVRFGWVDFIDDKEVSKLLFQQVENWALELKCNGIDGPLGFTDMDKEGLLIEGFDKLPTLSNIYNFPYYQSHIEALGYGKQEDWLQFKICPMENPVPEKIARISKIVLEKNNLRVGKFKNTKEILPYGYKIFRTLNLAFSNLYGFVELTEKEVDLYIKKFVSFIRPELVCFVLDDKDDIVAFGVGMPNLSRAFQKARGKLFPFGLIHILRAFRKTEEIELLLNGVHPNWQKKGVVSIYFTEMNRTYIRLGVKIAITNQQLESNVEAINMWKNNYKVEEYIRRRCFIKKLSHPN